MYSVVFWKELEYMLMFPNMSYFLLRSKELEQACSTAMLQGVGVQAIVTEYLISHADLVFSDQLHHLDASAPGAAGKADINPLLHHLDASAPGAAGKADINPLLHEYA